MIKKRIHLYLDEKTVKDLDDIANDYGCNRNDVIHIILQRKLNLSKRYKNEPDMEAVNKFVHLFLQERFGAWDILIKNIFIEVQKLAYHQTLKFQNDDLEMREAARYAEDNYRRYLSNEKMLPPHWQILESLNTEYDDEC